MITQLEKATAGGGGGISDDDWLKRCASDSVTAVLQRLRSGEAGLSDTEAESRLRLYGPNDHEPEIHHGGIWRLVLVLRNPLVLLLALIAGVNFATGDLRSGAIVSAIALVSVLLRFIQEQRAGLAAQKLREMTHISASVMRGGSLVELPMQQLVPGDVIHLAAGDLIPADLRIISAKELSLNQSALTGESLPADKTDAAPNEPGGIIDLPDICLLGTSVQRGSAQALVLATGKRTYFHRVVVRLATEPPPSSFDRGVSAFTWMMIGLMAVMVPLVFVINGLSKHNWQEAFFFAVAVAVGLTPEMLPMIVAVCLSKGAMTMCRRKVIVKRLDAIQSLGAMDVLCTDKTGTLTQDRLILKRYCDLDGKDDTDVLLQATLVSHFQAGLKSALDRAVLDSAAKKNQWQCEGFSKVDEVPFDFVRRIMSVIVSTPAGQCRLIAKGAPEELAAHCDRFEKNGQLQPMDEATRAHVRNTYERLSTEGFRVLAVAYREVERRASYSEADEADLVLRGYIAFLDPPKDSAGEAIAALKRHGLAIKVLSGDELLVCEKICREVGLDGGATMVGAAVERATDGELAAAVEKTTVFARLSPLDKERVITKLQRNGHVVGYLGDGINDAPALHAADVGVSVDDAVDVAKAGADVILLEKSLLVLDEGVIEGRKVFANILKYLRMGASSNFGNMFSFVGASLFLPFVPLAPIQVLVNNLLYDLSQVPIPTDEVDPEQMARPQPWSIQNIERFILVFGPVSSLFDYVMFLILLIPFDCWQADAYHVDLFRTGWLVESLITQALVIHVIRTRRIPFFQSWASWPLLMASILVAAVAVWLPKSPAAGALGLVALPAALWVWIGTVVVCYLVVTQLVKSLLQHFGVA